MRAWVYTKRGRPDQVLELRNDIPLPAAPQDDELVIRVSHVSLTPSYANLMPLLPFFRAQQSIPEIEFSGTVERAGPAAAKARWRSGAAVFGSVNEYAAIFGPSGALAEYITVRTQNVHRKPRNLNFAQAACLLNAQVALKMCDQASIKEGDVVLLNGASGGVGTMAVQVLKALGARVVAICSRVNLPFVRGIGADEAIDYQEYSPLPPFLTETYGRRPFDAIFDCVNTRELYINSPGHLKESGTYVTIGAMEGFVRTIWGAILGMYLPTWLGGVPRRYVFHSTQPEAERRDRVLQLVKDRKLKPIIDKIYDMEDAIKAFDRIQSKRARGKILVKVQD